MRLIPEKDFHELQRHPESGIWYVRKYVNGKDRTKSTGEKLSKVRAKQIALRILSDWFGKPMKGYIPAFEDIALEYLELKKTKSPATSASARNSVLLHLNPYFGSMAINAINDATFEDFVNQERVKNPRRKLFNDWKHFIGVMNRAKRKGLIEKPLNVSDPDPATRAGKVYTRHEEIKLLRAAGPTHRLQILLGIKMGMRIGEILGLEVHQINLSTGFIKLEDEDTKTRTGRIIPIHRRVKISLKKAIPKLKGTALFPTPGNPNQPVTRRGNKSAWTGIKRRSGVVGRFHDLRHTCATRMAEGSMHPVMAARILGMSVEIYDKVYCKPKPDALMKAMQEFARLGY